MHDLHPVPDAIVAVSGRPEADAPAVKADQRRTFAKSYFSCGGCIVGVMRRDHIRHVSAAICGCRRLARPAMREN
jgi:hypothetical protein